MTYLFDFKSITNPQGIQDCLKDWKVEKIADRVFRVSGRDYTRHDLLCLYMFIGKGGHIFIYDYQDDGEFFYQKHPRGQKRAKAIDLDLDVETLRCIAEHQAQNVPVA